MHFYPAYKLRDVLDEYAITFFSLLNEGYRQEHEHYQMLTQVVAVPYMKEVDRKKFLQNLQFAARDPSDILRNDGDPEGVSKLKSALGK